MPSVALQFPYHFSWTDLGWAGDKLAQVKVWVVSIRFSLVQFQSSFEYEYLWTWIILSYGTLAMSSSIIGLMYFLWCHPSFCWEDRIQTEDYYTHSPAFISHQWFGRPSLSSSFLRSTQEEAFATSRRVRAVSIVIPSLMRNHPVKSSLYIKHWRSHCRALSKW